MANEVSIYGQRRIGLPSAIPEVRMQTSGVANLQDTSRLLAKTGQDIADAAAESSYLRAQTLVSRELSRISNENMNDPEAMSAAMSEWSEEFTAGIFDVEVREKIRLQIETKAQTALSVAMERKAEIAKQEQQYDAVLAIDTLQREIEDIAPLVASGNLEASRQLQEIIVRGDSVINQTSPDGTHIFSPEVRARRVMAVRDGVPMAIARAAVANSSNPMATANSWLKNGLTITMPDENGKPTQVNIRDAMSYESREKADSQIMGMVRDQMAIINYGQAQSDRARKARAEQAYTTLMTAMQDNPQSVPVEMLDLNRNVFTSAGMADEYLELRKRAIGQEPEVENGQITRNLTTNAIVGNDVVPDAIRAYNAGQITSQTLDKIRNTVKSVNEDTDKPIGLERKRVIEYVGKANQFGVFERPEQADAARLAFDNGVNAFVQTNNRQPDAFDLQKIGEGVRRSFSPQANATTQQLIDRMPRNIPTGWVNTQNPTMRDVDLLKSNVKNMLISRFGADTTRWPKDDKDLVEAYEFIRQYETGVMNGSMGRSNRGNVE